MPGGPYKSKLGKYLFFNMVKNIFLLVGSRTMSSNLLGRYFSVHGIFSVFEFIGDRDFTQNLSIFICVVVFYVFVVFCFCEFFSFCLHTKFDPKNCAKLRVKSSLQIFF